MQIVKPKPIKHHVLGVRVDEMTKERIEAAAAAREWSVSKWLAVAARDVLEGKEKA